MKLKKIKGKDKKIYFIPKNEGIKYGWEHHISKGVYDKKNLNFIKQLKLYGECIDIGSNIGLTSINYSDIFSKVYSIEAHPETYDILTKNIEINRIQNIKPINIALGDTKGNVMMTTKNFDGYNHISENGNISVKMNMLDNVIKSKKIGFIKIDVEGFELSVLNGMKRIISENYPVIQIEILEKLTKRYNYHPQQIIDFMISHKYVMMDANSNLYSKWINVSELSKEERKKYRGIKDYFFIPTK